MEKVVLNELADGSGDGESKGDGDDPGGSGGGGDAGVLFPPPSPDGCVPNSRSYIMAGSAGAWGCRKLKKKQGPREECEKGERKKETHANSLTRRKEMVQKRRKTRKRHSNNTHKVQERALSVHTKGNRENQRRKKKKRKREREEGQKHISRWSGTNRQPGRLRSPHRCAGCCVCEKFVWKEKKRKKW